MEKIITNIGNARFKSKTNNGESANYVISVINSTEFPEFSIMLRKRVLVTTQVDFKMYSIDFKLVRRFEFGDKDCYLMEQIMGIRKQSFDVITTCVDQIMRTHRNSLNQIHSN